MKMIKVFEIGEEVYIKAKVVAIVPDKDRFTYELSELGGTEKFKHRFQEKDLKSVEEIEAAFQSKNNKKKVE